MPSSQQSMSSQATAQGKLALLKSQTLEEYRLLAKKAREQSRGTPDSQATQPLQSASQQAAHTLISRTHIVHDMIEPSQLKWQRTSCCKQAAHTHSSGTHLRRLLLPLCAGCTWPPTSSLWGLKTCLGAEHNTSHAPAHACLHSSSLQLAYT
jgi:hypothetical protein